MKMTCLMSFLVSTQEALLYASAALQLGYFILTSESLEHNLSATYYVLYQLITYSKVAAPPGSQNWFNGNASAMTNCS